MPNHDPGSVAAAGAARTAVAARAARALRRIEQLRAAALALEAQHVASLAATAPAMRRSARNLVHYLAVRAHDIRPLQSDLARLGLSSLGRMEAHALASLELVAGLLRLLVAGAADAGGPASVALMPVDLASGSALLARHATAMLGPAPTSHRTRIMVSMPTEAADDPALVGDLLEQGMHIMRINCAHDGRAAWERMLARLRHAEQRLGRSCKVCFDIAGPKLRTGPIAPAAGVVKWRPRRDAFGRVIAPAVVILTAKAPAPASLPGQCALAGAAALIAAARIGDVVALIDARGKRRRLTVVEVTAGSCTCHADATAYVTAGTALRLCRGERALASMVVGALPPRAQSVLLKPGDRLDVTDGATAGRPAQCDRGGRLLRPASIGCTLPEVFKRAQAGQRIYFDDGRIGGVIRHVGDGCMRVAIVSAIGGAAKLGSEKGINLPDTDLRLPALTVADRAELDFIVRHADMIGLSFVQRASDVADLLAELERRAALHIGIVLKIETRRGFSHLPSLLLAAMRHPRVAVMAARGDLGVEVGFERLSEVQEEILWLCEAAHVPVIWATQVLESLAREGLSSRAEVTDAAMAGRAECVMLNKGPYIREALVFLGGVLHRMQAHQRKKTPMFRRLRVSRMMP